MRKFILLATTACLVISADNKSAFAQLGRNPYIVYCDTLTQAHPTRALIVVIVPPDADVFLNDVPTQQKGLRRHFLSPVLEPFTNYVYDLKIQRYADGKKLPPQVKTISVGAGRITWEFLGGPFVETAPLPKTIDDTPGKKKL